MYAQFGVNGNKASQLGPDNDTPCLLTWACDEAYVMIHQGFCEGLFNKLHHLAHGNMTSGNTENMMIASQHSTAPHEGWSKVQWAAARAARKSGQWEAFIANPPVRKVPKVCAFDAKCAFRLLLEV